MNVHPGTSRWTLVFVSLRSNERCSASVFTAALDALYAGLPGGFVIPCLLPVMTMEVCLADEASLMTGRKALMPLMTPKMLVSKVCGVLVS